jgi:hypothetical protein
MKRIRSADKQIENKASSFCVPLFENPQQDERSEGSCNGEVLSEIEDLSCLEEVAAEAAYERKFDRNNLHLFHSKQQQLGELAHRLSLGGAHIDDFGRLISANDNVFPNNNDAPILPIFLDDEDDNHRQFVTQQELQAARTIERILQTRYKHTSRHNLQLIHIQMRRQAQPTRGFTFRRICCAVMTVVTAFVLLMIRSMPSEYYFYYPYDGYELESRVSNRYTTIKPKNRKGLWKWFSMMPFEEDPSMTRVDTVLSKIANIRLPTDHIQECGSLQNRNDHISDRFSLFQTRKNCSDGVLHIPSLPLSVIHESDNLHWLHSCRDVFGNATLCLAKSKEYCPRQQSSSCFRGIHDGRISNFQVNSIITFGRSLIRDNQFANDHFDVHFATDSVPRDVIESLQALLTDTYRMPSNIRPVAFRIYATAPKSGNVAFSSRAGTSSTHPLLRLISTKHYTQWMSNQREGRSSDRSSWMRFFSFLPWWWSASGPPTKYSHQSHSTGDTCRFVKDIQVDQRFQVLTQVFLSDNDLGGAVLFGDDVNNIDDSGDATGSNWISWLSKWSRRNKIIKCGLSVEGRLGRVVVSSGDNRRCRLPTRQGIRAVLQVWWSC